MVKHEKEMHESASDEEKPEKKVPKPRAKKVRTEEQIKADKEKMAKLRAMRKK